MNREVLGTGVGLEHGRVHRPLQAPDHRHTQLSGEIGILTIGFHTTAPAGVAENIDIGCPEGKSLILAHVAGLKRLVFLYAGFVTYGRKHLIQQRFVEGGGHSDGHRKYRCLSVAGHPVQGFVPPVVCRNAKGLHRCRGMLHKGRFFFQRHLGDERPGPLLRRGLTGTAGQQQNGQSKKG